MKITKDELRELIEPVLAQVKAVMDARDKRIAAAEERAESLERRASRHAEHLARLETRLKALEHGK